MKEKEESLKETKVRIENDECCNRNRKSEKEKVLVFET